MSNTAAFADNSASRPERRRHARQPISTLAYLDIGQHNGGIVLNLTEDGMAFQAVAPLQDQTRLNLRIQIPNSRTRIETEAQIIWLGESKCHAGVRFLEMPPEVRRQFHEWLRSLGLAITPSDGTPEQPEIAAEPQIKKSATREPRNDKWLSLMAEFEARAAEEHAASAITEEPEEQTAPQSVEEPAPAPQPQESAPAQSEPVASPEEALAASVLTQRHSPYSLRSVPAKPSPPSPPKLTYTSVPVSDIPERVRPLTPASPAVLATPSTAAVPFVPAAPAESTPLPISVVKPPEPPAPGASSQTKPANYLASAVPALRSSTTHSGPVKWTHIAGIAVLVVLLAALGFALGKWVGGLNADIQPISPPPPPATLAAAANPGANATLGGHLGDRALARPQRRLTERGSKNAARKEPKRESLPQISSPSPSPSLGNSQTAPLNQSATLSTPAKPPANLSVASSANSDSQPTAPAPTIVAGRALKPTDRFNPSHLTYRVEPAYPTEAAKLRIEGAVRIHLKVGADGTVQGMKLLTGSPLLAPAAMDAAKYWEFLPALLNGQPVETEQDVEIDFRLPR
jgi:TonB family protein